MNKIFYYFLKNLMIESFKWFIELSNAIMQINMLLKIGRLRKSFSTPFEITNKRFFLCMDSEMIKEVAPFSELFSAVRILTFHNSSDSFCNGMFESQNFKMTCIRYMFTFANSMKCLEISLAVFFNNNFSMI